MKKTFEIPRKGVKVYSPEKGWSDSPPDNFKPTTDKSSESETSDKSNKIDNTEEKKARTGSAEISSVTNDVAEDQKSDNMVAVGDALEQLFETLNNSSSISSPNANPTWRDVAELSRILEEKLDTRKNILDQLSIIDEDLHSTRKELLLTLKKLGKFENEQLSAATIRASVSAMAIEVLAKKLT